MRQDKALAKAAGIPKALRQYSARYGEGVEDLLRVHNQNKVPLLDHGRDRAERFAKMAAGVMAAHVVYANRVATSLMATDVDRATEQDLQKLGAPHPGSEYLF